LAPKPTRLQVPTYDGLVHVQKAAEECGVSVRTLRRSYKAYSKKSVAKDQPAKSIDGRPLPRSYVPRAFLDWFQQRRKLATDSDQITRGEAATILEISPGAVYQLILRGILHPVPGRIACKGGYPRKGILLSRAEVAARRDAQQAKMMPSAARKTESVRPSADGVKTATTHYYAGPPEPVSEENKTLTSSSNEEYPGHSKKPYRTGRRPDEARNKACYDRYVNPAMKVAAGLKKVQGLFPGTAPKTKANFRTYARQYASLYDPPLPLRPKQGPR
jgi:hypothetical protein